MKRIDRYIRCIQGIIDQDTLFIVPEDYNAICRVDLQQRKAGIESWLDDKDIISKRLFFSVILSGERLVLVPGKSDQVIIYHLDTRTLKRIDIFSPRITTNEVYCETNKFFGGFFIKNNVYLLATTYPAILKINIDTGETVYIVDWIEEIRDRIPEGDRNYFSPGFALDGNYAYIPGSTSGTIVRLDCNTDKTYVFKNQSDIKFIHGIITYKEDIWVLATTDRGCSLLKWIPERGFLDEILIEPFRENDVYWWNPLEIDGSVYVFQSNGANVYKVDMQEKKVIPCMEVTEAIGELPKTNGRYHWVRLIGEYKKKIIFLTGCNRRWFEFDTVKQRIDSFVIEIIDDEYEKRYWNKPYMNESDLPLGEFLKAVSTGGSGQNDNMQKGIIADQIYGECKITG